MTCMDAVSRRLLFLGYWRGEVWPIGNTGKKKEAVEHEERVFILPDPLLKGLHGWLCWSTELHILYWVSSLYCSVSALTASPFPYFSGCRRPERGRSPSSLEPMNVTFYAKRDFVDVISSRILRLFWVVLVATEYNHKGLCKREKKGSKTHSKQRKKRWCDVRT